LGSLVSARARSKSRCRFLRQGACARPPTSAHASSPRLVLIMFSRLAIGGTAAVHAERSRPTRTAPDEWRARVRAGRPAWRAFPQWAGRRGVSGTRACFAEFWQDRRSWCVVEESLMFTRSLSHERASCSCRALRRAVPLGSPQKCCRVGATYDTRIMKTTVKREPREFIAKTRRLPPIARYRLSST